MATLGAFIRRDALNWASYRFAALWQAAMAVAGIGLIFMIGKTIGASQPAFLARYNTDYIGYLMTSIVFVDIWSVGFLLGGSLRESQSTGTLEVMLLSPFSTFRLLLYSAAFPMLVRLVRLVLYSFAAVLLFGLWQNANLLSAAAVFLSALAAMVCLGILSVSFVLVLKQGDPVIAIYGMLNGVFAGVFFPREVLPEGLQFVSALFPLTHALEAMRRALQGELIFGLLPQILGLSLLFLLLVPITLLTLNWAIRRAKQEGSLIQY